MDVVDGYTAATAICQCPRCRRRRDLPYVPKRCGSCKAVIEAGERSVTFRGQHYHPRKVCLGQHAMKRLQREGAL